MPYPRRRRARRRRRKRRSGPPQDKRYKRWPKTATGKIRRALMATTNQLSTPVKFMHFRWRGVITCPTGGTIHAVTGTFNINKCNDGLGQTGNVVGGTYVVDNVQAHGHKEALAHGFDLVRAKSFKLTMEFWNPARDLGITMLFAWWYSADSGQAPAEPADDNAAQTLVSQLKLDPKVRWTTISFFATSHERGHPGSVVMKVPDNFALTKKAFNARAPATNVDATANVDLSTGNVITARDLDEPLVSGQVNVDPRKDMFLTWVFMRESGRAIGAANDFTLIPDVQRYVRVSKADLGTRALVPISTLGT